MRRLLLICAAIVGLHAGQRVAAACDLIGLASSRLAGAYVGVEHAGQSWTDQDEVIISDLGTLDIALAASVDRPGLGLSWTSVFQRSFVGGDDIDATGGISGAAASAGSGAVANALGFNGCFSWFSASEPQEFVLSGSAFRRGEAASVIVRLTEISGEDLFVLRNTPDSELVTDAATILLRPDASYGLFAVAVGDLTVHDQDNADSFIASYAVRLTPVPQPATGLVIGLAFSTAVAKNRRRRATRAA